MTGFGVTRIHRKIWRGDALRWLSMNVFPSTSPASFRMQFLVACQRSSRRLRHWSWRFPGTMGGERRRMPSRPYKVSGALVCHLTQSRRKRNGMYCFGVFLIPSMVSFCMAMITGLCFALRCLNRRKNISNATTEQCFHHGICFSRMSGNDLLQN